MLSAFLSAFRTPDLRKKLLFTLGMVAIYRLGATVPSPGVSYANVQKCVSAASTNDVLNLLNLFFGLGGLATPFIGANLLNHNTIALCYLIAGLTAATLVLVPVAYAAIHARLEARAARGLESHPAAAPLGDTA